MKDDKNRSLFYLDELSDYKVKSGDPDVRGWHVKDKDQRVIGKVDNLLVNKNTEKVVYLDVEVDPSIIDANHKPYSGTAQAGVHEVMNKDGENHVIIPIGLVNLNHDDEVVNTNEITHKTFAETKRKRRGSTIDREYEIIVLDSYNRDDTNYPEDDSLYERDEYDTKNYRNT